RPPQTRKLSMSLLDRFNLGHGFKKYFELVPATDQATRNQVYGVRHEVYCEDLHFEPERPDRREIDLYDAHSLHCLLRTKDAPYDPVGCVRIVMADPADMDKPLPFELTCADALDRSSSTRPHSRAGGSPRSRALPFAPATVDVAARTARQRGSTMKTSAHASSRASPTSRSAST
ncbi:GNAT family N-acyltransferase, partial [Arthrospira platensis SPKY1]|nr:GNAT family N-acyltransferase [Arthrospira platensis SPKY1]